MYWLQESNTTSESDPLGLTNVKGSADFVKDLGAAIKTALDPFVTEKFFLKLEEDAKAANAKISGQFTANAKIVEDLILNIYTKNLELGFQYKDSVDFLTTMADQMGKMVPINDAVVKDAILLGKALGISSTEVAKLYAGFTQMGLSQEYARDKLNEVFKIARQYGVDATKLTATVSANVFKAQAYGFKDGIDGLTKMAVQAQKVGISLELAQKAADKAFDPEGAIEMASAMQMLGGNVGALADPFQLLYLAQSDVGELQNQIGKASASMVDFNSKTGEFTIPPEARRNLTDQAKAMGMSYDELAGAAIKFRKEQELSSRVDMSMFSEADRNLITSFAEIGKEGEVKVRVPGMEELVDIKNLTKGNLEVMKDDLNADPEQVAKDQLSVLKNIDNSLKGVKLRGVMGTSAESRKKIISENEFRSDEEKFGYEKAATAIELAARKEMESFVGIMEKINLTLSQTMKSDTLGTGLNLITETMILGFKEVETAATALSQALTGDLKGALETLKKAAEEFPEEMKEILKNSGLTDQIIEDYKEELKNKLEELKSDVKAEIKDLFTENTTVTPENVIPTNLPKTELENLASVTKEEKTQTIQFAGEIPIKIEIKSDLTNDVLGKVITNEDVAITVKSELQKAFSKGFNENLSNPIPITEQGNYF